MYYSVFRSDLEKSKENFHNNSHNNSTFIQKSNVSKSKPQNERVRCQSSVPNKFYKDISDGSVKSDKEGKDHENSPVLHERVRKTIEPSDLKKDLTVEKPIKSKNETPLPTNSKLQNNSQKIPEKEPKKEYKKEFYNPTEDYTVKVTFEPSKIMKNKSQNDANIVDSNSAIRKFK